MPPPPKPAATRQRRNRTTTAATLEAPAASRVDLPQGFEWHVLTAAWWETIWASPMAGEWVDADVPGLFALANLVDQFWTGGDPRVAAEIRLQQREYGLSPLSRRQLQWEVRRLEGKPAATTEPPRQRRPVKLRALA